MNAWKTPDKIFKTLPGKTDRGRQRLLVKTSMALYYLVQQRQKIDNMTVFFPSAAEVPGITGWNILNIYSSGIIIFHRLDIENERIQTKWIRGQKGKEFPSLAMCVFTYKVCHAHQGFIKCNLKHQQKRQTGYYSGCHLFMMWMHLHAYRCQEILTRHHSDAEPPLFESNLFRG